MLRAIRSEEILDSALDDSVFEALSTTLADALGARSGVIHWREPKGGAGEGEVSYSGYFPDSAMQEYERHFGGADLWSSAVNAPGAVNRAWNCEDLIPRGNYANSRIFNDWIRPMGDDTFHCLGAVLALPQIVLEVGFHRGRAEASFEPEAVTTLQSLLPHIGQAARIRAKLRAANRARSAAQAGVDAIGCAIFSVRPDGFLVHHNEAAMHVLERADGLRLRSGRIGAVFAADNAVLLTAISMAAAREGSRASALPVHRAGGGKYDVSVVAAGSGPDRYVVLAVSDPEARDGSLAERLRGLYGLSVAEAEIAIGLCDGGTISDLADGRETSIGTVRNQVKAVAAKLGCGRQSEIVGKVTRLPPLRQR